jgi:hypothetical protein
MNEKICPKCGNRHSEDEEICLNCQFKNVPLSKSKVKEDESQSDLSLHDIQNDIEGEIPPSPNREKLFKNTNTSRFVPSEIIPISTDINQFQKPNPRTLKLLLSEKQQSSVDILQDLIKLEGQSRPVPRELRRRYKVYLKGLFAIIFFSVIIWSLVRGGLNVEIPQISDQLLETHTLIENIPKGSSALMAIDYEPGFSAEMDTIASALIDHLIQKNITLTVISTTPTGPIQAERIFSKIIRGEDSKLSDSDSYTNLGYIPGGQTGLLSFTQSPQNTKPVDVQGNDIWNKKPLKNINSLADFDLVIVATENAETAKIWIEQVEPFLEETPIIMIVSAQLEALALPYYEAGSDQIQGLISGHGSGLFYESISRGKEYPEAYWNAFNHTLLVAGLLIVVGVIISLSSRFFIDKRKQLEYREK